MNLPAVLFAVRLLVRDTFRQAIASGVCWLMLGVSALCILLCLSVRVEGDLPLRAPGETTEFFSKSDRDRAAAAVASTVASAASLSAGGLPIPPAGLSWEYKQIATAQQHNVPVVGGEMTLAFGALPVPLARDREHAVHFIQLQLAAWVADAAGLSLALVWTAGFLPSFLEPSAASVLLAKPVPRWSLLAGKFVGVLAFVGCQSGLFVGGTWLALALRTGVWDTAYFLCVPVLLIHFAIFFSFSMLLAVATRSTVACVFGSVVFWLLCWGMNYGRHVVVGIPDLAGGSSLRGMVEIGYWVLPKPADIGIVLFNALEAGNHFGQLAAFQAVQSQGAFLPELSIFTSLLFMLLLLAVAAREFMTTDY
jgi:hypothetical protein